MDSDNEENARNNFAKQGGQALNLDDGGGFNDSEDADEQDDEAAVGQKKASP